MKIAFECQTKLLGHIQPFADFDFLLVHKVLEDPEYTEFYVESKKVKFLDNSVNEKGTPCTIDEIEQADKMIGGANYIIAPDFIGEMERTIESYIETCKRFEGRTIVPVIQGKTLNEARVCASIYIRYAAAQQKPLTVSIPYDIGSEKTDSVRIMGERRALLISALPKEVGVHLLGFTYLDEFIWYEGRPNVLSIDTGAPILLGLQGKDILDLIESKAKPTLNQMEELELDTKSWAAICRNIALFRKYTQ